MIKHIIISLIIINLSFSEQKLDGNSQHTKSTKSVTISKFLLPPIIDGLLQDAAWEAIPITSDFVQDEPYNMEAPTERTDVKVAYDEHAIYIAVRLHDEDPDAIIKHLGRRDGWKKVMMSDWFSIEIDSYYDHQTAFEFLVNSTGVQFDDMVFDDSFRNIEWDAVWESEVSIDENGWNVEMRIPFSVLRFSDHSEIIMGINLNRYIQRKNELISWVVSPRGQAGIASKFGSLLGISGLKERKMPLSIKPYITSGVYKYNNHHLVSRDEPSFDNENKRGVGLENKVGVDIKYLIGQDIVNDVALNPDYGQIEADPAYINISYFETYFVEKRPFFMENATLFDTPIEVFYSRRIGTNRDYLMGNWQANMNSIVKYAGKLSGKTNNGLSFGVITAVTNDNNPSWIEVNSNSNFFVGRVTQDLFEGNSYIGFLSTIYNDPISSDYVSSIDMLSYFLENQLVIDWQIINSKTEKSGTGFSFEMSYNPTVSNLYSFLDMEYFDRSLNINDVGYLYRNNLKKIQGGVGLYWPELDLPIPVLEARMSINFNKMSNLDDLVLNNSIGLTTTFTFDNFWYMGAGFNYLGQHNDDLLLYDYYKKILGPPITIPKGTSTDFYFGTDPHRKLILNSNVSFWKNDFEESQSQAISFGVNSSEYMDFNIEYSQSFSEEQYRWIESYENKYIFATSKNKSEKFIYQINYNHSRKTSVQLYAEYYTHYNHHGQYYELIDSSYLDIEESNFYFTYEDILEGSANEELELSPQDHVYHYTKDHILNLNMVLNYEFRPGSNIYVVYSVYRDVVGKRMNNFSDFLKYTPQTTDLSEVNFTQSLYLKLDYWFDF